MVIIKEDITSVKFANKEREIFVKRKTFTVGLLIAILITISGFYIFSTNDTPYKFVSDIGEKLGPENREPIAISRGRFSQNDINLLARTVFGEARGEPYPGQVAIAAVVLNRIKSPNFPDTIPSVIFEPLAFTAVADGQIWLTPDDEAFRAVNDALNGSDPTGGALYYFNPQTATSDWIWSRPQIGKIGKHIFTR